MTCECDAGHNPVKCVPPPTKQMFSDPFAVLSVAESAFAAIVEGAVSTDDELDTDNSPLQQELQRVGEAFTSRDAALRQRESDLDERMQQDTASKESNGVAAVRAYKELETLLNDVEAANTNAVTTFITAASAFGTELRLIQAEEASMKTRLTEKASSSRRELLDKFVSLRMGGTNGGMYSFDAAAADVEQTQALRRNRVHFESLASKLSDMMLRRITNLTEHRTDELHDSLAGVKEAIGDTLHKAQSLYQVLRLDDATGGVSRAFSWFKAKSERSRMKAVRSLIVKLLTVTNAK